MPARVGNSTSAKAGPTIDERVAEQVADAMFALSTPSRVQILGCLKTGPHSVTELIDDLGMEQSAVSHQLRVLRDQNLVRVERLGRQRVYALHDEYVAALLDAALSHVDRRGGTRKGLFGRMSMRRRAAG
jgi:DNA-binding transcriptional ArsR family regulator